MNNILNPQKHTSPFKFFLEVNHKEIFWIVINIILYCIGTLTTIMFAYFLGKVIDALNNKLPVNFFIWAMVLTIVIEEVSFRFGHAIEILIKTKVRSNIKKALFEHSRSLSFGYFVDHFAGEIAHNISICADSFEQLLIIITNGIVYTISIISISVFVLGIINIWYAFFVLIWSLCFIFGNIFIAKRINIKAGEWALQETRTSGKLVDVYANIGMVKVYGREEDKKFVNKQIDIEGKALYEFGKWELIMYAFVGVLTGLLVLGLIFISGFLYKHALITIGIIVSVAGIVTQVKNFIWGFGPQLASLFRFYGEASQNLNNLVVNPAIIDDKDSVYTKQEQVSVEYCNVFFGYDESRLILNDFSFSIKPKEKIGIVGLSGAGKTTFANLLLRFFDVQKGEILLNGVNIKNYSQEFLRSHISYISQDTSLFHMSIAENISYGCNNVSQSDIEKIAKLAYADDFIKELPNGYESIVGERGIKLSGGQRQRIAIARALLANRPLFLLDEATSALDSDSEQKIQNGLTKLMENKTVIAIAHRLSTLSNMDRIIFMENGKIIEQGTHKELLALNGKYAKLWNMQAGGFLPNIYDL